jgi:hypothetical protein
MQSAVIVEHLVTCRFDFQNQNGQKVTLISVKKVGGDEDLVRKMWVGKAAKSKFLRASEFSRTTASVV